MKTKIAPSRVIWPTAWVLSTLMPACTASPQQSLNENETGTGSDLQNNVGSHPDAGPDSGPTHDGGLDAGSQDAGSGPTYRAASCNRNDVNAVINGPTHVAVDGDTILIPPGTCTWTSSLSVTQGIRILGAGSGSTIIQDGLNGTLFSVSIPSATSSLFRLSSLAIRPVSGSGGLPALMNISGTCNATTCSHIRIDQVNTSGWVQGTNFGGFLIFANDVFGVLDHLNVAYNGPGEFIGIGHGSYGGVGSHGDHSWAQPGSLGTDNALYIESSSFSSSVSGGMAVTDTDVGGGARFVVRFNTLSNASIQNHGTESTGRTRGGRQQEVYNNALTVPAGAYRDLAAWRSGTGVVFNNTETGPGQFNSAASLSIYRDGRSFAPWGACDGQGPYDKNDGVVYAAGTVTSASLNGTHLSVTDTSKSWTNNQWVASLPYSVVDLSQMDGRGFHPGATIDANTSNTVTSDNYGAWNGGADSLAFVVGDSYQILRASACIDQPGRGGTGATLLSGDTPSPTGWVNEPLDPIYEWGDRMLNGGTPQSGWVHGNWTARLAANRDFYSQTSPFVGTSGTGTGTRANRPATCTAGVAYWATDEGNWNQSGSGGQGNLYTCTAINTWTLSYTPHAYPHPLAD